MKCGGKRDSDFYRMRCVLACVGKDRMRPELLRVLVEKAKGGVTVVGCDGTRLRRDFFTMRAEPGLYGVRTNTSKTIYLEPSTVLVRYPDYRKVVPKCDGRDVYAISGKGSRFVMWVGAAEPAVDHLRRLVVDRDKREVPHIAGVELANWNFVIRPGRTRSKVGDSIFVGIFISNI